MRTRILKYIYYGLQILALLVWFVFFVWLVKPEIGRYFTPYLVSVTDSYLNSDNGIDLDPIILADDGSFSNKSLVYSTRTGFGDEIYGNLVTSDTRVIAMNRFLVDYGSPMAPYAETFVDSADEAGLDWRLVASISGVESAFGRIIPYNSYNAWGWRGGPGGAFSDFGSWENGISHVTSRIAIGYGTESNPFDMEAIYCPPCGENPAHAWANGVARYMNQLSEYRKNL